MPAHRNPVHELMTSAEFDAMLSDAAENIRRSVADAMRPRVIRRMACAKVRRDRWITVKTESLTKDRVRERFAASWRAEGRRPSGCLTDDESRIMTAIRAAAFKEAAAIYDARPT